MNTSPNPSPPSVGLPAQHLGSSEQAAVRAGREPRPPTGSRSDRSDSVGRLEGQLKLTVSMWRQDLREDLTRMIRQIEKVSSSNRDWEQLRRHLHRIDPEIGRLMEEIAPGLTPAEQKVSLLIGLGLPTDEIARTVRRPASEIIRISTLIADRLQASPCGADHATP